MNQLTFVGPRRRFVLLTVLSLVFVVIGLRLIAAHSAAIGWIAVIFFGLCGLVGIVTVARPQRLALDPAGFQFSHLMARQNLTRRWVQCGPFRIHRVASGSALIVFDSTASDHQRLKSFNQGLIGASEGFPAVFAGIKPEALAALMNQYRDAARHDPPAEREKLA